MNPILFSHIPKTAGTSFRVALEQLFGERKVLADYGDNAQRTSALVKDLVYQQNNRFALLPQLDQFAALSGHVKLRTYLPLFSLQRAVVFLRDPVQRVISEYRHFQRHMGYQGSLMDFARNPRNINLQSRYLMQVPLGSIGVVGLSERYDESLTLINHFFALELPGLDLNKAPDGESDVSEDECGQIRELNSKDAHLYAQAEQVFDIRRQMMANKQPFTFGGWRKLVKSHIIRGFAWFADNDQQPVEVEIVTADGHWRCLASDLAELSKAHNLPRRGFVGFQLVLPKTIDMSHVSVRVVSTGQPLLLQDYMS